MTYPTWGWVLGVATVTAVLAFGIASWDANAAPSPGATSTAAAEQATVSDPDPGPAPSAGIGQDSLTSTELGKARSLAETAALKADAEDVVGAAGPEYLSADIADAGADRTAELYYYDYRGNRLVKQVIDLKSGKLTGSYAATGMQLPPSEREVKTALGLLLANPLAAELKDAYVKATGQAFTGQALTPTAHIYHALPADSGAGKCGADRCLRLIVQTQDGHILDLDKIIVDLSGRTVARLN
jgi:hypothetical protein